MRFSTLHSAALVFLSFDLRASAHGFPTDVSIDGKTYPGANGPNASGNSPFRKVSSGSPVTDPTSQDIICGLDSKKASTSASANPGSVLKISWGANSGGNWFHNVGPIMTYMARCTGDCSSFSPDSSIAWFKIDEQGESVPGDSNTWAQKNLDSGAPTTVTIPKNLASGNYLMRHEIIALQNSGTKGGAEFYPSCLQLKVGGDATGEPDKTVHFPGAYKATDPGILGFFYNPGTVYTFPGGDVAKIGGSLPSSGDSGSDSGSSSKASPTKSSSKGSSSATPTATGDAGAAKPSATGRCRSRKRNLRRANDTAEGLAGRSLKMHRKRRSAHVASF